jgi:hypothetical protein
LYSGLLAAFSLWSDITKLPFTMLGKFLPTCQHLEQRSLLVQKMDNQIEHHKIAQCSWHAFGVHQGWALLLHISWISFEGIIFFDLRIGKLGLPPVIDKHKSDEVTCGQNAVVFVIFNG